MIEASLEWVRVDNTLPMPRTRVSVEVQTPGSYHIVYKGHSINLQSIRGKKLTELYYSLFESDKVQLFKDGVSIGFFGIKARKQTSKKHYIDYTCSRLNLKLTGLDKEFVSVGCTKIKVGTFGNEQNLVQIKWITPNYRLLDISQPPYTLNVKQSSSSEIKLIDEDSNIIDFKIKATIPNRSHRLNIAYGFGPYGFETEFNSNKKTNSIGIDQPIAPALMLYFNLNLSEGNSIRGFDAIVFQESVFNNLGIYYATDIASIFDNKLKVTTLLGVQHLYFKFNDKSKAIAEPIFPQGIEFTYKHAFDIEDYIISGGAFLSPSDTYDYQNVWVRWGKGIFWELNYIYWADEEFSAKMWGLSAGFFFGGYL
jgi:hypothetical protein